MATASRGVVLLDGLRHGVVGMMPTSTIGNLYRTGCGLQTDKPPSEYLWAITCLWCAAGNR